MEAGGGLPHLRPGGGVVSLTTDVMDRLAELGDSANQVADALIDKGITGGCENPNGCPIFNYLTAEGFAVQSVGDEVIEVDGEEIDTPNQIAEFIHAFDQHEWPRLLGDGGCVFWQHYSGEVAS